VNKRNKSPAASRPAFGSSRDSTQSQIGVQVFRGYLQASPVGGFSGLAFVGTPATIADQMEEWLMTDACDGFNILFPFLPAGLDYFVDRVVPELQRRGLYRREYEGKTLRENLGLPRPENRFFAQTPERLAQAAD
jgi:alkanesulfonate monooxygenase